MKSNNNFLSPTGYNGHSIDCIMQGIYHYALFADEDTEAKRDISEV